MSEPIRVLNVVGRMGDGGIESLIMNIYRNLDREKVQFDFLTHKGSGGIFEDEIRALGGHIYEMPVIRTATKTYYWKLFTYITALKRFFKAHPEYHVIHGHMTNTAAIYMPISKKYGKVTCRIAHSHQSHATPGLSGRVTNIIQKPIPKLATDYFACSEMAAHWIYPDEAIRSGKVKVIKNGVDPKRFHYDEEKREALRKELGLEGQFVLGHVGRFKTEKNQAFLVDVFAQLHKRLPESMLLLVGDGELRPEVEAKVHRLGLEKSVRFLGIRKDVDALMLAMDLFVLPSLYEGLPVVGVEAQATGLPVLTSTGVTRETDITGNVTFMELDAGAKAWADAALEIRQSFIRRDMYEYIKENGYDITETAAWLQEFYIKKHFSKQA